MLSAALKVALPIKKLSPMAPRLATLGSRPAVEIPADVESPYQDYSDDVLRAIDVFAGVTGQQGDVQPIADRRG